MSKEAILKGRLDGKQRNRLKSLFDMMYTPKELAEEIGINKDKIYMVYIPLGCPHERDKSRHIFINGKIFAKWYIEKYAKLRLKKNETFCLTCKGAVELVNPREHTKNGLTYALSTCPICGRGNLTKILAFSSGDNDK